MDLNHILDWLVGLVKAGPEWVVTAVLLPFIWKLLNRLRKWLSNKLGCCRKIRHALKNVSQEGRGLWLTTPLRQPKNYRANVQTSIPVLLIANLKGGVGKTTLAANLTASYAAQALQNGEKPVLVIDLDFQGSLSAMMLTDPQRLPTGGQLSKGSELISGKIDGKWLIDSAVLVPNVNHAYCIPSYYDLASVENRIMVEWLLQEEKKDIRYSLARIFHDPVVKATFSRIIIDAPPRMSVGLIQALCASTKLLIPTKLDLLSIEAVDNFLVQLNDHRHIFPELGYAGIAGTMIAGQANQDQGVQVLSNILAKHGNPTQILPQATFIPNITRIGWATGQPQGERVIYANPSNAQAFQGIRANFDSIRNAI